jgi:dolichol-phosphate mannosyltransferase
LPNNNLAAAPATLPQDNAGPDAETLRPIALSVVIPTFNEAGNVAELVKRLGACLTGISWEVIFVDDDSPDGTATTAKALALQDRRVRCLRRVGRRGLAGACIDGILSSSAPYVAVMDGDLQHDEEILPRMLAHLVKDEADLVVGSRYIEGGGADFAKAQRSTFSKLANRLAQRLLRANLADPMSGFFMMRRERFEAMADEISPIGFKILLDIVTVAHGELRIVEEPYVFRERHAGESKFGAQVGLEFLGLILGKLTGGVVGPRFLIFALVGASGLVLHLIVLRSMLVAGHVAFPIAQTTATFSAMISNFFLNNMLTYRDRRLRGFLPLLKGLAGFCVVSAIGALANIGMSSWLYAEEPVWWLAGVSGAVMGALWNYLLASSLVWRTR